MAFYSYPFESQNTGTAEQPVYDRAITAENERQFNKLRYTNGVFIESSLDDDLQVVPGNGMAVKVSKGGCHIEGALAYNDNDVTLSLEAANATLRRIDRVVARFNTSTSVRSIMVYVKTGTNATNPVAPALQHESNFWEIGLADITIPAGATSISASNILDTRMDDNLCGRVLPAIPYITQLGSLYEQYQELVNSALSGTVAGQLEARIAAEESKVQPIAKGGTGATTAGAALKALLENKALPLAQGGTGATTAAEAWGNLVNEYDKDGWHIKEYAKGYCALHYKQSITVSGTGWNPWGYAYVKDVAAVSYPVTFAEIPYQSVELQTDQNSGWMSVGSNTISTTGHHQMLRPSAGTAFKGAILYTVYGKLA